MTEAAQRFLRSFQAVPKSDQHEVLVNLLRLPLDAAYEAPSEEALLGAADSVFLALDEAEQRQ